MKKALLVLTLILIALQVPPNSEITAQYDEHIQYPSFVAEKPIYAVALGQTDSVLISNIPLVYGTHRFLLRASDMDNNAAAYEQSFTLENPLGLVVSQPSQFAVATNPRYDLELRTQEPATCEWRFYAAERSTMPYQEFEKSQESTRHSLAYRFGERYRLPENEFVPIQIRCVQGQTRQTLILETGWTTTQHYRDQFQITEIPSTPGRIDRDHSSSVQVTSTQYSTCTIADEDYSETSTLRKTHLFERIQTQQTPYNITCTNIHGQEFDLGKTLPYFLGEQQYAQIQPTLISNSRATQQSYMLRVATTIPSTCTNDYSDDTRMGAVDQGLLHQRELLLEQGTTTVTITCESETGQTETLDVDITRTNQQPSLSLANIQAEYCQPYTTIRFSNVDEQVEKVLIKDIEENSIEVLRTPSSEVTVYGLRDSQLRIFPVDKYGVFGLEERIDVEDEDEDVYCNVFSPQHIQWSIPQNQETQLEEFIIEIQSEFNSTCEITTGQETQELQADQSGTVHRLSEANTYFEKGRTELQVSCQGPKQETTTKDFALSWDLPTPEITVDVQPEQLQNYSQPFSTVTVSSDQHLQCSLDQEPQGEYNITHVFRAYMDEVFEQEYSVNCVNVHGEEVQETFTLTETFPAELEITQVPQEKLTNQRQYPFIFSTADAADCSITLLGETRSLQTEFGTRHEQQITLLEGLVPYEVTCRERSTQKVESYQSNITVDVTPPRFDHSGEFYTCGLDKYILTGSFTDNYETDYIQGFLAQQEREANNTPLIFTGLGLSPNAGYYLGVIAWDKAGNNFTQEYLVQVSEDTTCDITRPNARLLVTERNYGADIQVRCSDNKECARDFELGISPIGAGCDLQTYEFSDDVEDASQRTSEPFKIEQNSTVCYTVFDTTRNEFSDEKNVRIEQNSTTRDPLCSNGVQDSGEEGVDCGGENCAACDVNLTEICSNEVLDEDYETDVDCGYKCEPCSTGGVCQEALDCADEVCVDGTCSEATCEDEIQNQDETDVDCGGVCGVCSKGQGCSADDECEQGLVCKYDTCIDPTNPIGLKNETNVTNSSNIVDKSPFEGGNDDDDPFSGEGDDDPFGNGEAREEYADDFSDSDTSTVPEEQGASWSGIILIILGVLMAAGGGGYIYYEKEQEAAGTTAQRPGDTRGDVLEHAKTQDIPDFASSKLREEAREEKKKKRQAARSELMSEFSAKPEPEQKPKTSVKKQEVEQPPEKNESEPVHLSEEDEKEIKQGADTQDVFDELEEIVKKK